MLARSLIAVLLSIPASFAVIGVILVVTPLTTSQMLPVLLMVFPVWLGLVCGSYLVPERRYAALGLVALAAGGFGLIALLKFTGLAVI